MMIRHIVGNDIATKFFLWRLRQSHRFYKWRHRVFDLCDIACHFESGYAYCNTHLVDNDEWEGICDQRAIDNAWDNTERAFFHTTRFEQWWWGVRVKMGWE